MKVIVILLSCCLGLAIAQDCTYNHGNGQPACNAAEMNQAWRNNWDPSRYWLCETANVAATAVSCPTDSGFLQSAGDCVAWSQWEWTFPCDPPSVAASSVVAVRNIVAVRNVVCEYDHGNGQPLCIQEEMDRLWRNNWDPTRFWQCTSLNTPAIMVVCPTDTGFLESAQRCVLWSEWEWTFPCNPPSGGGGGGIGTNPTVPTNPTPTVSTPNPTVPTSPITPGPTNPTNAPGNGVNCEYDHGDGRPLCIQEEMDRLWRNNWDPTRFWRCITLNTPASLVICPTDSGFLESAQRCVSWSEWVWTFPCNPPSISGGSVGGGGGGGGGGGEGGDPPIIDSECEYDHGNGQPLCIQEEMDRLWRNNWDPTRFWQCTSLNTPATMVICPTDTGFLESAQRCVSWSEWEWTFPCNPPSGGGGSGVVTNPTVPTNPTNPTIPTNPTSPTIPTNPTNPTIPTNPTNPTFPTLPTNPTIVPTTPITPGPTNGPGNGACEYNHGNGRPLCIQEEMERRWRNNWDNTRYWKCETLNTPATQVICGVNTLFFEIAQECVAIPSWIWTPPCNPPSVR